MGEKTLNKFDNDPILINNESASTTHVPTLQWLVTMITMVGTVGPESPF